MAALVADVLQRLRELDIVLASTSPRRAEILRAMGLPFAQRSPPFVESLTHAHFASPAHYVAANAWGKALSILAEPVEPTAGRAVILASDTVVALQLDSEAAPAGADWMEGFPMCGGPAAGSAGSMAWLVLEKPGSAARAVAMLKALRGKSHFVFTAVAVAFRGEGVDGASLARESLSEAAAVLGHGGGVPGWGDELEGGPGLCLGTTHVPAAAMEGSPAAHTALPEMEGSTEAGSKSGATGGRVGCCVCVQSSRVEFSCFTDAAAEAYAAGGEPLDKAGGYAVQGAGGSLVRSIEGDYHAVMGLPMGLTAAMLRPAAAHPESAGGH